jgi:NAD-dependent SIR2 family protein deacetylase
MEPKLIRLLCKSCRHILLCWEDKKPINCPKCESTQLKPVITAATVPVTTGHMVEYVYDNVDTIDSFVSEQASIEEQERDLDKLGKGRRNS